MTSKKVLILILLSFLVSNKVCEGKNFHQNSFGNVGRLEGFLAQHGGRTLPSPTPHKTTVQTLMNSRSFTTGRFARERAAEGQEGPNVVKSSTSAINPSASPSSNNKGLFSESTFNQPPVKLTLLPAPEDTFSPPDVEPETKPKADDSAEYHDANSQKANANQDNFASEQRSRVSNHERPSHQGTDSKSQPREMNAHHQVPSADIRWNIPHDFGTGQKDSKRRRLRRKRRSEEEQEGNEDPQDPNESGSPIIIAAIFAGILVLLCTVTGLVSLCKNCSKRCFRRKDPEVEITSTSMDDFSEELSDNEIEQGKGHSKISPETKPETTTPQSSNMEGTHHSDSPATWTLTETPTSTPLMAVPPDCVASKSASSTIIDIDMPELSSPDNSFTCSSLKSVSIHSLASENSSLTSVSARSWTSALENESESASRPDSPISLSKVSLNIVPEPSSIESTASMSMMSIETESPSPNLSTPATSIVRCSLTSQSTLTSPSPHSLQTSPESTPSAHPATPKATASLDLSRSASDELTRTDSVATDSSSPSTESCKKPVAPRSDVAITIEDDEDEEEVCINGKSENVVIDISEEATNVKEVGTTKAVGNFVIDMSGVTCMNDTCITATVDKAVIHSSGAASKEGEGFGTRPVQSDARSMFGVTRKDEDGPVTSRGTGRITSGMTFVGENGRAKTGENAVIDISGQTGKDENGAVRPLETVATDSAPATHDAEGGLTKVVEGKAVNDTVCKDDEYAVKYAEDSCHSAHDISGVTSKDQYALSGVPGTSSMDSIDLMIAAGLAEEVTDDTGITDDIIVENPVIEIAAMKLTDQDGVTTIVKQALLEIPVMAGEEVKRMPIHGAFLEDDGVTVITSNPNSDGESLVGWKFDMDSERNCEMYTSIIQITGDKKPVKDTNSDSRQVKRTKGKGKVACQATDRSRKGLDCGGTTSNRAELKSGGKSKLKLKQKKLKKAQPGEFETALVPFSGHARSDVSAVDHNQNNRNKSLGSRLFKLPRKFFSLKSKSSAKHAIPDTDASSSASTSFAATEPSTSSATNSGAIIHWSDFYKNRPRVNSWGGNVPETIV